MRRTFEEFVRWVRRQKLLLGITNAVGRWRAQQIVTAFEDSIQRDVTVLDVGSGTGHVAEVLTNRGRFCIAADFHDFMFASVPYVRCNGTLLPFGDRSLDVSLILAVLHHVDRSLQKQIISEAYRVLRPGGKLLILEDTYQGKIERWLTYFQDSLMNLEFVGHPHSNRSHDEWLALFDGLGIPVFKRTEYTAWYGVFRMRHSVFILERNTAWNPHLRDDESS